MSSAIRNEWRLFIRAPASISILVVLTALATVGAVNGMHRLLGERHSVQQAIDDDAKSFAAKRAALVDLEAGRSEEGSRGSPRKAHQAVLNAPRPLVPSSAELPVLSAAARPTPELLRAGIMTRHVDQQPRLDDPSNRLDGPFDLVFVTTWLLPLFALVLGCDVLAGDRERGRAALLASQGAELGTIMGMRLLVRFAALFVSIAVVGIVSVLATQWADLAPALAALAVWLTGLAFYLAFWFALAAAVNVFARSAASAALALLCVWVAFSVAIPAVAGSIVHAFAPPPDRLQGVLAMRAIEADLNRRRDEVTAAYYAAAPQNLPIAKGDEYEHYFVTELYPRHLAFDAAYAPIAARMDAARVEQARLLRLAGAFSPTLAFRLLTEDLAGAAPERRVAFFEAVDEYQRCWRTHFDHKLASMRALTVADYDTKPEFTAVPEPTAARWGRVALIVATLLLPTIIASTFAMRRSRLAAPLGAS